MASNGVPLASPHDDVGTMSDPKQQQTGEKAQPTRPQIGNGPSNDRYYTAQDLHAVRRAISGQSTRAGQGAPLSADLDDRELARLGRALSSRNRRSRKSGKSEKGGSADEEEEDDLDVDEILGRIFHRDNATNAKKLGVAFKNLVVEGTGFGATEGMNIGAVLANFYPPNIIKNIKRGKRTPVKRLVNDYSGVVESGEMVLVLGRPGAGCTTFLKTIAGYTDGYKSVEGDLSYGGISLEDMQKNYRAEVTFNAEVDAHFATLSVQQTLDFAINCRTPHGAERLDGESRIDYRRTFRDVLGTIFGLDRVFKTKVGNDLIRGVSGGEKKRVSIAETLTTRASVQAWDSATRGLDSSTALEYVRALRAMTNMTGAAVLVALYQVSDQLTQLFDKIIVIEGGRQIYYGPVDEAQAYFEELGFERPARQPLADYLSSVADIHARTIREGYEERIPRNAEEMQQRFREHQLWKDNLKEVEEYGQHIEKDDPAGEFKEAALHERKTKTSRKGSNYTLSFPAQVVALAKRQYLIQLGDPLSLGARYVSAIFQAIIIGSLFYNIPETTNGAFLRGGVAFFALLFNALLAMSELTTAFGSRPILAKQKAFAFYRPSAWALANILADAPVLAIQILLFSVVIYFMANLQRTASQFFIFCLLLFSTSMAITAFFRALAAITPSLNVATPLSGIGIQVIVVYSGYLIPYSQMTYWLRWLYWINPIAYGFEALMANEFTGLEQYCPDMTYVPFGPTYTSDANKVCTLAGSQPGQRFVDGGAYILAQFGYTRAHLWRNFGAVLGFWIALVLIGVIGFEKRLGAGSTGGEVVVYKRGMAPKEVQEALDTGVPVDDVEANRANGNGNVQEEQARTDEAEKERQKEVDREAEKHLVKHESVFSWHHLNFDIGSGSSGKRLLSDISGYVKPGKLTALVGESGAGKTTLLTTLSQRQGSGVVTGDIFVDGEKLKPSFARKIGFCEQADVHEITTTVREALIFSATLRQPASVPMSEKEKYVDEVIALLELQNFQHAIIGDVGVGLNVEQRKRLTIGVELAAKPELLIFLDEPTSGLDAQSALSVVRFLRKLADSGQAILCTIHQPNAQLFNAFDALLLLGRGGKTMYFGDTGDDSKDLIKYFESKGSKKCPEGYNPAEWMLEVVGAGASASSKRDWHQIWNESSEKKDRMQELDRLVDERRKAAGSSDHHRDEADEKQTFAAPFSLQLRTVLARQWTSYYRDVPYLMGKFMLHIISALFNGFTFLQLGNASIDTQNRLFSTFLAVTILPPIVQQLQPRFIATRDLYEAREGKARIYGWVPMIITAIAVEIPWSLLAGCIYFPIWTQMVGLASGGAAAFMLLIFMIFELFMVSFGQAIAALSPNAFFASLLVPFFFSFVVAFCGVLAPPMAIPTFWRVWMVPLTPFRWILGAFLVTELHDLPINCSNSEYKTIIPPGGQSCQSYMAAFFQSMGPGYVANPTSTTSCQYCQYSVGDQYLQTLQISYGQRWQYFGYACAYVIFNWFLVLSLTYLFRIRGIHPIGELQALFSHRSSDKSSSSPSETPRASSPGHSDDTAVNDEPQEETHDENPYKKEAEGETAGFAGSLGAGTAGKTA